MGENLLEISWNRFCLDTLSHVGCSVRGRTGCDCHRPYNQTNAVAWQQGVAWKFLCRRAHFSRQTSPDVPHTHTHIHNPRPSEKSVFLCYLSLPPFRLHVPLSFRISTLLNLLSQIIYHRPDSSNFCYFLRLTIHLKIGNF